MILDPTTHISYRVPLHRVLVDIWSPCFIALLRKLCLYFVVDYRLRHFTISECNPYVIDAIP